MLHRLVDTERVVLAEEFPEDPLYADIERACSGNEQLRERLTKRTQTLQVGTCVEWGLSKLWRNWSYHSRLGLKERV